jgi:single-stranded-DNA-specific exonuclease
MDVLILDHHNAHPYTPDACLINNQTCDYPNKGLSGVGIVYKFCCYLDSLLSVQYAPQFLDLVAVGMIADMMPLNNYETRYMVSEGLNHINNAFLNGMVMKNEFYLKGKLTPHGVSFCIAPAVNAIARVGTKEERKLLFESMLDFCAYDMIPSTKRGCSG